MPTLSDTDLATRLRTWAKGDLCCEASVELLIRGVRGRLLNGPWVVVADKGRVWFSADIAVAEGGILSGGERCLLSIAASLADSVHVALADVLPALDAASTALVVAAVQHVAGIAGAFDTTGVPS